MVVEQRVISFLGRMGADGLGFLDGCGAKEHGSLGGMDADGLDFLDRFCGFGIVLMKSHAELPNQFLPDEHQWMT